jgi:hypothetical protein
MPTPVPPPISAKSRSIAVSPWLFPEPRILEQNKNIVKEIRDETFEFARLDVYAD